jgi:hypothetical protein
MNEMRLSNAVALACSIVELLILGFASVELVKQSYSYLNIFLALLAVASIPMAILVADIVYLGEKKDHE